MSFAGNGESEGRFEEAVPSKEVGDLGSVVDALTAWGVTTIAFAGHSMGGAVGVMRASVDPRINCLVSLAGMVHVDAFMRAQFGHLTPGAPMLEKPECPWSPNLADDAARIGSVTAQAARIRVPWLLVHGDADELVPVQDALDAREAAGGRPGTGDTAGHRPPIQRRAPAGHRRRRAVVARADVAQGKTFGGPCLAPVQSRVKRQVRGETSTPRRPLNPVVEKRPSRRCV